MWEWFRSWGSAYGDYAQYVVTSAGEVYDATTGQIVGYYDETTQTLYDGAGEVIDAAREGITLVYDDAKEGASDLLDFGSDLVKAGADTVKETATAARDLAHAGEKALNLGFLVILIPTAAVAYWYFLGRK